MPKKLPQKFIDNMLIAYEVPLEVIAHMVNTIDLVEERKEKALLVCLGAYLGIDLGLPIEDVKRILDSEEQNDYAEEFMECTVDKIKDNLFFKYCC